MPNRHIAYRQDPWYAYKNAHLFSILTYSQSIQIFWEKYIIACIAAQIDLQFTHFKLRYYRHHNHPSEFHSCILHALPITSYALGAYATGLGHQGTACKAQWRSGGGLGWPAIVQILVWVIYTVIIFLVVGQICWEYGLIKFCGGSMLRYFYV